MVLLVFLLPFLSWRYFFVFLKVKVMLVERASLMEFLHVLAVVYKVLELISVGIFS